ncbi:MAG: glycosyltransferase [Gammaproteobacteria bacterium]|nr:MAG: glycosyltransferase [Gammaproteobacteria bacterium]
MTPPRRLRICYAVPGSDLVSTMGPTRNVLNLARALARHADVTVAFRRVADRQRPEGIKVIEIEPAAASVRPDDNATAGIGYGQFLAYLRRLRRFAANDLAAFDVVLEKSWLLSGFLSAYCRARGQLGVPVENIVQNAAYASRQQWTKWLRMRLGSWVASRCMREARLVIAETEFLRQEIHDHWRVPLERIAVVHLGVDRGLFHPIDQAEARHNLGLAQEPTILTYVGVLDWTHNLAPVIAAVTAASTANVELHIVGDGARRGEYEARAAACPERIRFHGRVPHTQVPLHIAAADLCLAPYESAAFASGELGYSTMKIPEYLSVGRAVVSVPSGRIRSLITDGQNGFLFANETTQWQRFMDALPARERLRTMGLAAAAVELPSWETTAEAYYRLCVGALAGPPPAW